MTTDDDKKAAALERKKKRLEAWRRRQEQQAKESESAKPNKAKITLSLGSIAKKVSKKSKRKRKNKSGSIFGEPEEDESGKGKNSRSELIQVGLEDVKGRGEEQTSVSVRSKSESSAAANESIGISNSNSSSNSPVKKKRRWDDASKGTTSKSTVTSNINSGTEDDLDKFMNELNSGAMGNIVVQKNNREGSGSGSGSASLAIDVSGSMMRQQQKNNNQNQVHAASAITTPISGGAITPDELAKLMNFKNEVSRNEDGALYGPSDWETSASEAETDDEEEEKERQNFLQVLKKTSAKVSDEETNHAPPQLASEVQSEKQRRERHMENLKKQASDAQRASAMSSQPDIGRIYYSDVESGVMEEAERTLNVVNAASVDALEVLAELNKKKELKAVDHSKVEYLPIRKNLYLVPRSVANLSEDAIMERRVQHKIRVRGRGAPAPVKTFEECGLSERILSILAKMKIEKPYAVQSQCLPCIMAGRDVIGIAKTGSGKTLAYLLPMLRHIADQPPLAPHESGPIGLVLAPARELAVQIYHVTKMFAKQLGLKSTAVYGGAGVAEQIADLKRGTEIVVATPGRMIDILTMQSGRILSLQRVSYICLDEADRCYDMGFAPQISAILSAVRPDRQTVLFSATFPKTIETLARKSLIYPVEVLVGGRSVASDSVNQYAELIEEEDKFLRLLQLLGEHADDGKKVIIFVDTQAKADSVFEQLIRCSYPSLSLHGGKEQEDRDSTISDFKKIDGPNVLVATSVAGRGLDVPSCVCVINYSCPNHLEEYVHRVGRTGRAANKGISYTFCNSGDEAKFSPIVVRALIESGHSSNISAELRTLSDDFKQKVERGEARYAGSGFHGKGYTYDSSELNEAQKVARAEKRQALIEAGVIDQDEEDPALSLRETSEEGASNISDANTNVILLEKSKGTESSSIVMSSDLLALPGMKEAVMKKAGYDIPEASAPTTNGDHYLEDIEINDYPREARWKVTQKETTSRLQDEFQIAVTLKGQYYDSKSQPPEGERKLYLHVEARTDRILQTGMQEIRRLLNEETLRVGKKGMVGGSRYSVL